MKRLVQTLSVALLASAVFAGAPAAAADCNQIAQRAAQNQGAEILNVVASQNGGEVVCTITLRVPGKNDRPPRVVTRVVKQ